MSVTLSKSIFNLEHELLGILRLCEDPEAVHEEKALTIGLVITRLGLRVSSAGMVMFIEEQGLHGYALPVRGAHLASVMRSNDRAVAKLGVWVVNLCINLRAWARVGPGAEWDALLRGDRIHGSAADDTQYRSVAMDLLRGELRWLPMVGRRLISAAAMTELCGGWTRREGAAAGRPVVDDLCQVVRFAVELLETETLRAISPRRAAWYEQLSDDRNKPRTDSAWQARTRRYEGWSEPDRRTRYSPAPGGDFDSALERCVLRPDAYAYSKTWIETDERIYIGKRGETRRVYLGPATKSSRSPDYTTALSLEEARLAYDAFAFANRTGRMLNGKITVAWFLLQNASLDEQWRCFHRFYANLKQHFRDLDPAVVPDPADREPWIVHVHENPGGSHFHTHFAVAVPAGSLAGFRDAVRGIAERAVEAYSVNRSEGKLIEADGRKADAHACIGQWKWFHYMLKGTRRDEVLVEAGPDGPRWLDDVLAWRYENPGPARPRRARVRVTPNLDRKAQRAFTDEWGAGFVSLWDEQMRSGRVDVRQLYSDHYLLQSRRDPLADQGQGGRESADPLRDDSDCPSLLSSLAAPFPWLHAYNGIFRRRSVNRPRGEM